ncbi:MAG TPA: hypothetical protein VEB40_04210, partial [Flavipsychrobacter sp.]|nr:hypothetical protein [Flavipsychrobacter sp.]
MSKRILFSLIALFLALGQVQAQVLEEVNLSSNLVNQFNTYLTGINNRGFISGYYDSAGILTGFVINPNGVIKRFPGSGVDNIKVESINDNNVCVAQVVNGGNGTAWKAYYDTLTETFTNLAQISGVGYNNVNVIDINDNNDVAGWYPNLSERWLWYNRDSVNVNYDARRHNDGAWQPTYGGGINNSGNMTAFYIDGSNYEPLFFDNNTNTFTPITGGTNKMKVWDVNNNNAIAGEYNVGGFWIGFWAQTVNNNITVLHPMTPVFETNTPTIQSVVNGINDKLEMVGSYLHPDNNVWVGFIYRPLVNEYRFPDFDWQKDTWSMQNSTNSTIGVWTSNYWGSFNYGTNDPFKGTNPLTTPLIIQQNPGLPSNFDNYCVDWKSFAQEVDSLDIENSGTMTQYNTFKSLSFSRWANNLSYFKQNFPGICYGFAFTSLFKATGHEAELDSWFGLQQGVDLSTYANSDQTAIRAIARMYLKQFDNMKLWPFAVSAQYNIKPWSGLYRLKNTYLDTMDSRRNPRAIYIYRNSTPPGYHSILPYKIRTPKKFPFYYNSVYKLDTLYVYDSNYPTDSTQLYEINSSFFNGATTGVSSPTYSDLVRILFNEAGLKEMLEVQHSYLKSTSSSLEDPYVNVILKPEFYYNIEGSGSTAANYSSGGHVNTIPYLMEVERKDIVGSKPGSYRLDTSGTINVACNNYIDGRMEWNMNSTYRSMGLNRAAQLSETDYGTWHNHLITYGTHDNVTKTLNGYLIETNGDFTQGVNTLVQNITMNQNDSILTENPEQFIYKITRFGSTADTYDIWMEVTGTDSILTFHFDGVVMNGNSSHTIVPYFNGTSGTEVGIIIDDGNNGSQDDTLYIFATTVESQIKNIDGIRVYPNPIQKQLSIEVTAAIDFSCNIILADIGGKAILKQNRRFSAGKTVYNLP